MLIHAVFGGMHSFTNIVLVGWLWFGVTIYVNLVTDSSFVHFRYSVFGRKAQVVLDFGGG